MQTAELTADGSQDEAMKILESNKSIFYAILRAIFKHQGIHPTVAEVGVLEGDNAHLMLETLEPKELYLIDQWHPDAFSDYRMINDHRNWVKSRRVCSLLWRGFKRASDI